MLSNLRLLTDSYKVTHHRQYPPDTRAIYSFFESRGGASPAVVFFGLQYYLHRYLTNSDIRHADADSYLQPHFGSDLASPDWARLKGTALPVKIRAVPEGTLVPVGNVLMTVENTDERFPWLTNYIESLLVQVWYPCSVATRSRQMKRRILRSLRDTGTPESIDFRLHDFGFRGSSSVESSAIGGCAHLVNFKGTDTLPALVVAREVYGEHIAGFSVPAAEHSTITSWGKGREVDAYRNMLDQYPTGIVAVVSDSFDIFRACADLWGRDLKDAVLERDGVLVIRPDSGEPVEVLERVFRILIDRFGCDQNEKGFNVLHPKVRVIQGDGIDPQILDDILTMMQDNRWSADNITFGSGGGLLQKDLNRDTHKFAFKCCAVDVGGEVRDVMKDPITDSGKRSKAGRLALVRTATGYETVRLDALGIQQDELQTVFENGQLVNIQKFTDIRARAAEGL